MLYKRLLAILLVLAGIFFLAGCSSDTNDTSDDTSADMETMDISSEIVGTWTSENDIGPVTTDAGQTISGKGTFTYTFYEDDTVKLVSEFVLDEGDETADTYTETTTGTYSVEEDKVSITMTEENATNDNKGTDEDTTNMNNVAMMAIVDASVLNTPGQATIHKVTIDGDEMTMTNGEQGDFTFTRENK